MDKLQILEQLNYSFGSILMKEKKKIEHINSLKLFIGKPKYNALLDTIKILSNEIKEESNIINSNLLEYSKILPSEEEIEIAYNDVCAENLYPRKDGWSIINHNSKYYEKGVDIKLETCTDIKNGDSFRKILIPKQLNINFG